MFVGGGWPTYFYFITMGIGIVFLLINRLTKRIPRFKLWQTIIGITPIVGFYFFIQVNKSSEDIFIIQDNYKGTIAVIYGQKNGMKKEFENGKRVYRIPKSGTLKTQFDPKGAYTNFGEYYYETDKNERIIIEYFPTEQEFPDSTKMYVYNWQVGSAIDSEGNKFDYQQATIGRKKDTSENDIFNLLEK